MKRFLGAVALGITCSLSGANYTSLYRPFQRDVIILIDWASQLEQLSYVFHASGANLNRGLGAVASRLATALYEPCVPIITSSSPWITLLERAQFITDSQKLAQDAFVNKYLVRYAPDPEYKNTLLIDRNFLIKLYQFCRKSYEIYQKVNVALAQELRTTKDLEIVSSRVSQQFRDSTAGSFLTTPQDKQLWEGVSQLLLCYVVVEKMKKEQDAWIIGKAHECVYVMIPKLYLAGIKEQVVKFGQKIGMKPLNDVLATSMKDKQAQRFLEVDEIILGIKFKNLTTGNPFMLPQPACQEKIGSALSDSFISKQGKEFKGALIRILINARDLATFKEDQYLKRSPSSWVPHYCVWNVYGMGHGSASLTKEPQEDKYYYVMGLREDAISAFLDFLDSINTRFLYYSSCYAGGHRLRSLYLKKEQNRTLKKKYHYTIVVGAITQVATTGGGGYLVVPPSSHIRPYGIHPEAIDAQSRSLKPIFPMYFCQFFNDLHVLRRIDPKTGKKETVTYKDILSLVDEFTETRKIRKKGKKGIIEELEIKTLDPEHLANIPQIRFSGSAWFNVINLEQEMVRLSELLVRTKAAQIQIATRPEDKQLMIRDKKLLLVDAEPIWQTLAGPAHSEIPFPMVIQRSMPTVISMVAGNAWHGFEKINAQGFGLKEVIEKFWGVAETAYGRTYYIKELIVDNDLQKDQSMQIGAQGQPILVLRNVYSITNAPDPRNYPAKQQLQGVIFEYNGKLFASLFSLTDPTQTAHALNTLKQGKLPNLQNIPGPVPGYEVLIRQAFPHEVKEVPISLENIARFIVDKRKHIELVKQYATFKKTGQKALNDWKKTLTKNERGFIQYYEAMEEERMRVLVPLLLQQLTVQLTALKKQLVT